MAVLAAMSAAPVGAAAQRSMLATMGDLPVLEERILAAPAALEVDRVPLAEALADLETRAAVPIAYSPVLLPAERVVSCDCRDATVGESLRRLLRGTGFEAFVVRGHIVLRRAAAVPDAGPLPAAVTDPPNLEVVRSGSPARGTGTIHGRVVDATTLAPVHGARVSIPDLGIAAITQGNGLYTLTSVPTGTHGVEVARIGFRTQEAATTIPEGRTVERDFSLPTQALSLDEVVVTGTAGGARMRAVGNAVGRIDAEAVNEVAPVRSIQELIGAREPGVTFNRASGTVGAGSEIRIRGTSSIGLGNQPLIYVDGVRVDNAAGVGPAVYDGRQAARLDDFNPDDIESIEIIKGPAAATLYGTEASAGVIQIITKRGIAGAPSFDMTVRQGANWLMNPAARFGTQYGRDRETGELLTFNVWDSEAAAGRPFLSPGHVQAYNASMRGGTEAVRYYLAADVDDSEGMVDYNHDSRFSFRANLGIRPSDAFGIEVSTGYVTGSTRFMQGRTSWGMYEQAVWANPADRNGPTRGFMAAPPEEVASIEALRDYVRFTGGVTLFHDPAPWFSHRLVLGADVANDENRILVPRHPLGEEHFFAALSLGELTAEKPTVRSNGLDYSATASFALRPEVTLKTSFGLQYHERLSEMLQTVGRVFPSPAIRNMAGAATSSATQEHTQNKTLGMYLQQEVSYADRFFLTAAVRGDDSSTFGAHYDAALYPKLSATWVITDEPFWSWDAVGSLRLRSAWGQAGRQPDAFAAVTLYEPEVAVRGRAGVAPRVLGNPNVGPEISTELEVGFDASMFDDRVSSQFTYYTQTVTDALLSNPVPPSSGFPGSQVLNLGRISNAGWELALSADLVRREAVGFELGMAVAHNRNRIDDLGAGLETETIREGFPYPALTARIITNAEWAGEPGGEVTNVLCDGGTGAEGLEPGGASVPCDQAPELLLGSTNPSYEWSFDGTLRLMRNVRLYALAELRHGDYWRISHLVACRHWCFPNSRAAIVRDDPVWVAANSGAPFGTTNLYNSFFQAGFAKLREVSVSYSLPSGLADRLGARSGSISLGGRELWTIWREQETISGAPIPDPEISGVANVTTVAGVPPLASLVATLRLSF